MPDFDESRLLAALMETFRAVEIGAQVHDEGLLHRFGDEIDGLFRMEAARRDPDWPPGSTTDGSIVHVCWRSGVSSVVAVGLTWLDFSGDKFLSKADITLSEDRVSVAMSVGLTGRRDTHPCCVPASSIVSPLRDEFDRVVDVEVWAKKRQPSIEWTQAFEWHSDS